MDLQHLSSELLKVEQPLVELDKSWDYVMRIKAIATPEDMDELLSSYEIAKTSLNNAYAKSERTKRINPGVLSMKVKTSKYYVNPNDVEFDFV